MMKKAIIYITWIKILFLFLGLSLLFLGWLISKEADDKSYEKVIFMLDVSNSMNIQDVFYNGNQISRLDMAKIYITDYINYSNSNVGVILFSNKANLFIVPSKDKLSVITYLNTVNSNSMKGGGSNIYEALVKFIEHTEGDAIGFLLSDFGDNIDYQEQIDMLEKLDTKGKKIIPIGIGTSQGGLVVDKNNDIITNNGTPITDKLNLAYLERISSIVSQPYQIFSDEKKFTIGNNYGSLHFELSKNISPKWLLMIGGFFVVVGL